MSKIETGQFSSFLRRYLGMKGVSDVVDELAPEISAVLTLEVERPEWEFLKGARLMAFAIDTGAIVGFAGIRIRNPTASGVIGIFDYARIGLLTAGSVLMTIGATTTDQGTVSGNTPRDGRNIPPSGGALICSFGTLAPGGTALDFSFCPANTSIEFLTRTSVVIPPGFALNLAANITDVRTIVAAHWLEKRLDDLERQ